MDTPYKHARRIFYEQKVGYGHRKEITKQIRASLNTLVSRNKNVMKQFKTFTKDEKIYVWRRI